MGDWKKFERDLERGPSQASLAIGKWVLVVGIIVMVLAIIFGFLWKPFDVVSTVTNTNRALNTYEYFYTQAEAHRAIQVKIERATAAVTRFEESLGPRKDWGFEDKTEHARLVSIADGLRYQCADIVADYNAKAQQVTRSIFKTDSTPYLLQECN